MLKQQVNELILRMTKLEKHTGDCMDRVIRIEEKNDVFEHDIYQLKDDNKILKDDNKTLAVKQEILSNALQKRDSQTNNIKFILIILIVLIIVIFILLK